MDIQELRNDRKFHEWHEYEPMDVQYVRYIKSEPSILAAGHKINDVYHTFCDARGSMLYANYSNYGELCADNDISRLYIKNKFLKDALIEYAICLDLSWQVIWAFIQPSSFKYLIQQNYEEMEKICTGESVHIQLNCAIAQKSKQAERIKELLTRFENEPEVIEVRKIYNSIKHRGIMYFQGFCTEDISKFLFDKNVEMPLKREVYDSVSIQKLLLSYHEKFEKYFIKLIDMIMPSDYKINKVGVVDYMIVLSEIKKIQEECDK